MILFKNENEVMRLPWSKLQCISITQEKKKHPNNSTKAYQALQVNFLTLSLCTSSGAFLQYLLWSYADLCTGAFVLVIFYAWNYLLFNLKMTFQFIQISAQTLLTNIFITVLSKITPHNSILPILLSFLKIMTLFILCIFVCYVFYIFYSFLLSLRKK